MYKGIDLTVRICCSQETQEDIDSNHLNTVAEHHLALVKRAKKCVHLAVA